MRPFLSDSLSSHTAWELSRLLKLDHIDASQRDLVNDRTRQSVSRNLILIGVIARYPVYRHDYAKTRKAAMTYVKRGPLCDAIPTETRVVIPLSFRIF